MDVLKALKKASKNEYASVVGDGTIFDVKDYVDTGCLLLNALISGSLFKGVPTNKTICYSGQSTTGKTFLIIEGLQNYLNKTKKNYAVWFASEKGFSKEMLANRGVDVDRVILLPVSTVEDFNRQSWDILIEIQKMKEKDPEVNVIILLDSLGMLNPEKEFKDLEDNKKKEDMTRAKHIRKAFRNAELKMGFLNVPMFFTNHVYTKTGSFIPMDEIAGGYAVKFASDIIIAMTKAKDAEGQGETYKVNGVILTCTSYKNRHAKENTRVKISLNYDTGLDRYSGLFDFCIKQKIFEEVKEKSKAKTEFAEFKEKTNAKKKKKSKTQKYKFLDKEFTEKEVENDPENFWTNELLISLDDFVKEHFEYGNEYRAEKEEIEKEKEKLKEEFKNVEAPNEDEIKPDKEEQKKNKQKSEFEVAVDKAKKGADKTVKSKVKVVKKDKEEPVFSFEK